MLSLFPRDPRVAFGHGFFRKFGSLPLLVYEFFEFLLGGFVISTYVRERYTLPYVKVPQEV